VTNCHAILTPFLDLDGGIGALFTDSTHISQNTVCPENLRPAVLSHYLDHAGFVDPTLISLDTGCHQKLARCKRYHEALLNKNDYAGSIDDSSSVNH
jgi:hypothetical protein